MVEVMSHQNINLQPPQGLRPFRGEGPVGKLRPTSIHSIETAMKYLEFMHACAFMPIIEMAIMSQPCMQQLCNLLILYILGPCSTCSDFWISEMLNYIASVECAIPTLYSLKQIYYQICQIMVYHNSPSFSFNHYLTYHPININSYKSALEPRDYNCFSWSVSLKC